MKTIHIIKVGTTFEKTASRLGDFDTWTAAGLSAPGVDIQVVDMENGQPPPPAVECSGIVITGSHAMVTDNLPWSIRLEQWLVDALEKRIPILGICYGHQLLARAAGGTVGFHPSGKEVGTVPVRLLAPARLDPLFSGMPDLFYAHATHAQTVLDLPPGAVCLAAGDYDPHQVFRIHDAAWGVQFHPEYSSAVMADYVRAQEKQLEERGQSVDGVLKTVKETPEAAGVLANFSAFVTARD